MIKLIKIKNKNPMNIQITPIGHTIEYAQLENIENWLFSSDDNKMPFAFETIKPFLEKKPLIIKKNEYQISYKSFIHYCLSNPAMVEQEALFVTKLAQIFSNYDIKFVVDLLLTEDKRGLNCYNYALKHNFLHIANYFEKIIETYNLKHKNQNIPGILESFADSKISISTFIAKIEALDTKVFEAITNTSNGIQMSCAHAILILHMAYPNDTKLNAIKSLVGKDKFESLFNTKHSTLSIFSNSQSIKQTKEPFVCPLSPLRLNDSLRSC